MAWRYSMSFARASLFAAVFCVALPALADEDATPLVVLPYASLHGDVPQSVGDKVAEVIAGELKSRDELTLVTLGASASGDNVAAPKAADPMADGKASLTKAAELARKNKFKPAGDAYAHAIAELRTHADLLDNASILADAYLQYAVALLRSGADEESETALVAVVRLDPVRQLSAETFPGAFIRSFENVRRKTLAKPRGALKISSAPAGGKVKIDGVDLGETPLLAREMVAGEHFVRVERGGLAWGAKVDVAPSGTTQASAVFGGSGGGAGLAGLLSAVGNGSVDRASLDQVRALAKSAKAQVVLFGAVAKDDDNYAVSSFLYSAKEDTAAPLTTINVDAEFLSASIEVLKLADDIAAKLEAFPTDTALPIVLASPKVASANAGAEPQLNVVVAAPPALEDRKTESSESVAGVDRSAGVPENSEAAATKETVLPRDESASAARATEPAERHQVTVEAGQEAIPLDERQQVHKSSIGSHWMIWAGAGFVAVGALAYGGYYLATHDDAPTSATANISWSH